MIALPVYHICLICTAVRGGLPHQGAVLANAKHVWYYVDVTDEHEANIIHHEYGAILCKKEQTKTEVDTVLDQTRLYTVLRELNTCQSINKCHIKLTTT